MVVGRQFVLLVLLLVASSFVLAAPPFQTSETLTGYSMAYPKLLSYKAGEDFELHFHIFNQTGAQMNFSNSSCYFHLYNSTDHIEKYGLSFEAPNDYVAFVNGTYTKTPGEYPFVAYCGNGGYGAFVSGMVQTTATGLPWAENEDLTPVAVIILLPFLLGVIILISAITLDPEDHAALKIGLFLFSYLPFYMSLWWGAEAAGRWYNFPSLSTAIGDGTFYGIIFFILLVFYVVAYFIWKAFEMMAQNKKERLKY
jgi:hypothetical protein